MRRRLGVRLGFMFGSLEIFSYADRQKGRLQNRASWGLKVLTRAGQCKTSRPQGYGDRLQDMPCLYRFVAPSYLQRFEPRPNDLEIVFHDRDDGLNCYWL